MRILDVSQVSPVKNQGGCGSCTAFATMALVETCFKKTVGVFGDYSEQQLLDCAYGSHGIYGCSGTAGTTGYAKWLALTKPDLAAEETYPYTARVGACRTDYQGRISSLLIGRAPTILRSHWSIASEWFFIA